TSVDYIARKLKQAQETGEPETLNVLAKYLNVEIGLALRTDRWAGADYWQEQSTHVSLESLAQRCEVIDVGIDGGGLDDLLGLALVGRDKETGDWLAWVRAWAHPSALKRNLQEAARFEDFARDGDLRI